MRWVRALPSTGIVLIAALSGCAASEGSNEDQGSAGTGLPLAGTAAGVMAAGTGGTAGTTIAGTGGAAGTTVVGGMAGTTAGTMPAGTGGMAGTAGMAGMAGSSGMAGMAGAAGMAGMAGTAGAAGTGMMGDGMCCDDGDCLCHGDPPSAPTSDDGPFEYDTFTNSSGCIYYPTTAEPPFAAVAVSDGFLGAGGCGSFQTGGWGPLLASWGIVAMIINTGGSDPPATRGSKLSAAIESFKAENEDSGSELYQKLAGRYGTSGFSMGGGGTTYSASEDPTLLTNVPLMPWGPVRGGVTVPTLLICGASDGIASCSAHGTPFFNSLDDSVMKVKVTVSGGHNGQPSAGGGNSGEAGLAFHKAFLEGDERWLPILKMVDADESNIP